MQRQQIIKDLFIILDKILTTGEIIFSRDSLMHKLNKMAAIDGAARYYARQTIGRWEERSFFKSEKKKGEIFYRLTPIGCRQVNRYRFKTLKISDKKWDGWWRIIVFDIPEEKRVGRDALRKKLKILGFYSLQKSVFIYPFQCEREIEILGDYFNVSEYIELFLTRSIGQREKELNGLFGL